MDVRFPSVLLSRFGIGALAVCLGSRASALDVCAPSVQLQGGVDGALRIPIIVSGSGVVDAVGLEFAYTGSAEYLTWTRGNLVRDWEVFEAAWVGPRGSRLRFGGFQPGGSVLTGNDTLAVVVFGQSSRGAACLSYRTDTFVDDLAGAAPCEGTALGAEVPTFGSGGYVSLDAPSIRGPCCFATPDHTQMQVIARLPPVGTYDGAEFRIEIRPPAPAATLTWQPSAALLSAVGDPVDNTDSPDDSSGVAVRFASCSARSQGTILLGTIDVVGLHDEHEIVVTSHNRPARSGIPCAQFRACDGCEAPTCMAGADPWSLEPIVYRAQVNSCDRSYCVAVRPQTWTQIKHLYR